MAIARKPAKPAAGPEPKAAVSKPATPALNPADLAEEDKSLAGMPVQILEAATTQLEVFQEAARDMSLRSVEGLRATYGRMRAAAEDTVASMEKSFAMSGEATRKLQVKALENMQAGTVAMFDFAKGLAATTTVSDALTFSNDYFRKEIEAAATRGREFAELAQSLGEEALAPLGKTMSNAFGIRA